VVDAGIRRRFDDMNHMGRWKHPILVLAFGVFNCLDCQGFVPVAGSSLGSKDSVGTADTLGIASSASKSSAPLSASGRTVPKESLIFLLSLQYPVSDKDPSLFSKTAKDVWRWKDAVLGDGRDFFLPKPKTLNALNKYLRSDPIIQECVVLSNCARLEVLIVADRDPTTHVSELLWKQVQAHNTPRRHQRFGWQRTLSFDRSDLVDPQAARWETDPSHVAELQTYWHCEHGLANVTRHCAAVAAGLAPRPRRPDRSVVFAPFSSRDAHILLQLKRTLELARTDCPTLAGILCAALTAGKAARNPRKVPALEELRPYGTGNSKYDRTAPREVTERVATVCFCVCVMGEAILVSMPYRDSSLRLIINTCPFPCP
jgi:hypothetical protein